MRMWAKGYLVNKLSKTYPNLSVFLGTSRMSLSKHMIQRSSSWLQMFFFFFIDKDTSLYT